MKKKHLLWIIPVSICLGIVLGMFFYIEVKNNLLMKDYDLYHCIYSNADDNGFNKNPIMIKKIQDECICFRMYNYTNLLGKDCSNFVLISEDTEVKKGVLNDY